MNNIDFSVALPAGWIEKSSQTFQGPLLDGLSHSLIVVVDKNPSGSDVYEYAKSRVAFLHSSFPTFEIVREQDLLLEDGTKARDIMYTVNRQLIRRQIFLMPGQWAFTFISEFTRKSLKFLSTDIESIVRSLKTQAPRKEPV